MHWQRALAIFSALAAAVAVVACPGEEHEHVHDHRKREYPQVPLTPPGRPLVWSDVNVIHTTDSHGWLLGHQKLSFPEPNYSGDFGDFASFVTHMKAIAEEKDTDLLLIDTGDLHDGTGLSDGFPAGQVDGHETNNFIMDLPYDLLAIGNHELYDYANAYDMYTNFAPHWNGRYLSSNVNITIYTGNGNETTSVPVGERYVKFKTRKGRSVTSLGVLYDFTGNDVNTTVQTVAKMVKEDWFTEAIKDEPDFFLLLGHMPVRYDNWPTVYKAIRKVHKYTPILIFGGHTHIRDCTQFDGRSMALESGRYMETVGWLSANLGSVSEKENITFTRRYLDANRVTYEYHTNTSNTTYDTTEGQSITTGLQQLWNTYDLSYLYGTAPQDYTLSRDPYPSNGSVLSLLISEALPYALTINNTRVNVPNIILTNSGELRYDIFAGAFDKNDQLTALPFADSFLYIPNVTLAVAEQVLPGLNKDGENDRRALDLAALERAAERYARGDVSARYNAWLAEMSARRVVARDDENLTLGYVTTDQCPGVGDDTPHTALPYYSSPDYLASDAPSVSSDTSIDLVFIDFIETDVLEILNDVQSDTTYTKSDVLPYSPLLASAVLGLYAQEYWN